MRVKICGIKNEAELEIAVNAGADAIGFLVGQRFPSPDFILPDKAARLAALLPPFVTPVLVTHLTEPEEIAELIERTGVTTVQLHGGSSVEQVRTLRRLFCPFPQTRCRKLWSFLCYEVCFDCPYSVPQFLLISR